MHDFEYVPKKEWKPIEDELFEIIHRLQDEVRDDFTFHYSFVGSRKYNMITRDRNSNTGFDFDVNIEVNDPDENYSATEIRNILRKGLDKVTNPYGYSIFGYDYTEDSTRIAKAEEEPALAQTWLLFFAKKSFPLPFPGRSAVLAL